MDTAFIWGTLLHFIGNPFGVAGLMGNLEAESGMRANNLQNSFERKLGVTDAEYTSNVDNGRYTSFVRDGAGYGLAQWTYPSRKQNLLALAAALGDSIGSVIMQVRYIMLELMNYSYVLSSLVDAKTIEEASDAVLWYYEKPASITDESRENRRAKSRKIYNEYRDTQADGRISVPEYRVLKRGSKGPEVERLQKGLIELGYGYLLSADGADGVYGAKTITAVKHFQADHLLYSDGTAGSVTQYILYKLCLPQYTVIIKDLMESEAQELTLKYSNAEIRNY